MTPLDLDIKTCNIQESLYKEKGDIREAFKHIELASLDTFLKNLEQGLQEHPYP